MSMERYLLIAARLLAAVALFVGLAGAARLLGIWDGDANPLVTLGLWGFVVQMALAVGHLFAAVGLWIRSSWGTVVLIGTSAVELALTMTGYPGVDPSVVSFGLLLVLFLGAVTLFGLVQLKSIFAVHD